MRQRCFATSGDNRLTELAPEALQARLSGGEGTVWVDVEDYRKEELEAWFEALHLSPGAARACAEAGGRTQVALFNQEADPYHASKTGSDRLNGAAGRPPRSTG